MAADDADTVEQCATEEHSIFQFKNQNSNNTDNITLYWKGQTDLAPISSTVYLQIYNRNTTTWETVDSDNTTAADTDFVLTNVISVDVSDYYDGSNWVSARVYQEMT